MTFPSTRLAEAVRPSMRMPLLSFPEMRLRASGFLPPITLAKASRMETPLPVLGRTRLVFSVFLGMPVSLSAHSIWYSLEHVQEICSTVHFHLLCYCDPQFSEGRPGTEAIG